MMEFTFGCEFFRNCNLEVQFSTTFKASAVKCLLDHSSMVRWRFPLPVTFLPLSSLKKYGPPKTSPIKFNDLASLLTYSS